MILLAKLIHKRFKSFDSLKVHYYEHKGIKWYPKHDANEEDYLIGENKGKDDPG